MEFRPHWMATRWQESGHEVLVVCGDRSHLRTSPKIDRGIIDEGGVTFLSLPTTPYAANGPARFVNLLSFRAALRMATPRLARFEPDVVIASSTHPFDVRPAYRLAGVTGAKFVFEVHDLWPLTPILLGGMSPRHPVIRLMQREEGFAYRHADLAVSLLPETQDYMRSRGLSEGRWIWIPNGVRISSPESHVASSGMQAFRDGVEMIRHRWPSILIYAGGHGISNALDDLLGQAAAAQELGIAIVLLGSGPLKADLRHRYSSSPNVFFFDPVPRSEVVAALRLADFAYAGGKPSPLYRFGISFNKIYDYMAAGIPVIENIAAANSPVGDAGGGIVADPADPDSLVEALRGMAQASQARRRAWGDSGRRFVEENLRQDVLADRMIEMIRAVPRRT